MARLISPIRRLLTLARFESRVALVDYVNATAPSNDAASALADLCGL